MNRANRPRLSRISGSSYASKLLGRAGDGSTLTLDFTTGVLDPRLTFTRSSDATFINSSGLVQYADANWVRNSTMLVSTGWTATTVSGGTATINGDGSVTFASTAGRITWLQTLGLASGLPITFSIEVTALTAGDIRVSDLFAAGFGFGSQIYHHTSPSGVTQNNISSTAGLGTFGVGLYTVTATTTGTTNNIIFGTDCNGVNRTGSVTIRNPQLQYGTVVPRRVYVPNSSTSSAKWDSARFDYDPTTLAPKGLLIEGSATSLTRSSQDLTNASYWTLQSAYASTSATGGTAPDGTNTGNLFTEPSTSAQRSIYQSYSSAAGTYTFSVWLRAGSGSTRYMRLVVSSGASDFGYVTINMSTGAVQQTATVVGTATNASAVVSAEYTATGWRRYSLTVTLAASVNFVFLVPMDLASIDTPTINYGRVAYLGNGSSFLIWGAQLEAGSGASSYIPTGASQGTRARDECSITGGSFSSWFTNPNEGSFFVQYSMNYPSASMGAGIDRYAFEISDSSGSSRALCIAAYRNAPPGQNVRVFNPSGTSFDSGDALTTSSALNTKFAFGYATANNYIAAVGVAQAFQTYNTGSLPTSPAINQMWLGSNRNLSSTTYLFGCIRTIKYWPTRLPNATLQGLVS